LGAGVIGIQDTSLTSMRKGESFEDTIRMIDGYSDLIVIRHPESGSAKKAADVAIAPVINAGDGSNEHPTQMLLDLYTIYQKFKRMKNVKCVVGRDPLHSRTIRSFLLGLTLYPHSSAYILAAKENRISKDLLAELRKRGLKVYEIFSEKEIPVDADVWYWNRIQQERFKTKKDYLRNKNKFIITPKLLKEKGNTKMIIMNPLPRAEEIVTEVDADPRAYYFQQAKNGLYVRMALLALILKKI